LGTRVVIIAVVLATAGAFVAAAETHHRPGAATPTLRLAHSGHVPPAAARTFVSLLPSCACSRRTTLTRFALSDGRPLSVLGTLVGAASSFNVSQPHPQSAGSFDITFSSGPQCLGRCLPPTRPVPNSCSTVVKRVDVLTGSVTTVLRAPASKVYSDAIPSPDGRQLVLEGGGCTSASNYLTVRNLASGRQRILRASENDCMGMGIGPAAWSPDGTHLVFPYAPQARRPPDSPQTCYRAPLPSLAIARADRASGRRSWTIIHADRRCGFLYGVFDPNGIAAVEGCEYGAKRGFGGHWLDSNDAFLLQLTGADHRVTRRLPLKLGFAGGAVVEEPRTGTVLISEYQTPNNGDRHVYNWLWAYSNNTLRLIRRYNEYGGPEVTAEPW
jgi:hypothetical protein